MNINWTDFFAGRARELTGSQIRNYFRLTERPEVISFAGGFPDSDLFPREDIARTLSELVEEECRYSLQYAPTEGNYELRAYLACKMRKEGIGCEAEDVIVLDGTQQGLDLLCRVLVNPGDPVLVEEPAYIGGMGAIKSYGGIPVGIPIGEDGICPAEMEKVLGELAASGKSPRLFYTVPNFQNPTGFTTSLHKRIRIMELASRYNFIIVEDNPYGELCYEGEAPPSFKSLDREGRVAYLGSFSKTFIPGIRVGWLVGAGPLLEKVVLAKQTADLCSGSLGQRLVYRLSVDGYVDEHVSRLKVLYREKRDTMLYCMEKSFPPDVAFTRCKGGFFVWVTFPSYFPTASELLNHALERKVAFVHGEGFFSNGGGTHTGRFSFSQPSAGDIQKGIDRLGKLFYEIQVKVPLSQTCPGR